MDSRKLEDRIKDWAFNLGFTLPAGSAPTSDYFKILTATPHRRQLWETLLESIKPRQEIKRMRKQIVVASILEKGQKTKGKRTATDKFNVLEREKNLKTEIEEERNAIAKLEKKILTRTSDLLFEYCKLSELQKQVKEFIEKAMVLKIFSKKKEIIAKEFQNSLLLIKSIDSCGDNLMVNSESCRAEDAIQDLWEETIKNKETVVNEFSQFLDELNSMENCILREKKSEIENSLNLSITELKQKTTERALQVIINSVEEKLLDEEILDLEERVFNSFSCDASFNDTISFSSPEEISKSEDVENLKNHLDLLGLKCYRDFLKAELNRLEEERTRKEDEKKSKNGEEEPNLSTFEAVSEEINSLCSEKVNTDEEILNHHAGLETLVASLRVESAKKAETAAKSAEKLKSASLKLAELFLETPSDVFKTIENPSGGVSFECESPQHCLKNYAGEFKQMFSGLSIPPARDMQIILEEVEKRKKIVSELTKFATERKNLGEMQRKIENEVGLINYDRGVCENNFKESDEILGNVLRNANDLLRELDFIKTIFSYWMKQRYRHLIGEKELEDKCKKDEEEKNMNLDLK